MVDPALLSQVERLSAAERLELIEAVWATLSDDQTALTAAEEELLDSRIQDAENNPDDQTSWPEVRERLRRQVP